MFNPTNYLRMGNSSRSMTFRGFTKARFKTLYIDPQTVAGAREKAYSYTNQSANNLTDLSLPAVQNSLWKSMVYAQDAASAATEYFAKRPTTFHRLARMEKIFKRHFKNTNPSDTDRATAEATLRKTSAGLNGRVVISDLFAGADRFNKGSLVWGAEGQVAFDATTDAAFMNELLQGNLDDKNDVMRRYLSTANSLEIYVDFSKLKQFNVVEMARVIIHEATHKFAYTGDYAYFSKDSDVAKMTAADALKNADSYAYAVISVKERSALTPVKARRLGSRLVQ